MPIEAFTRLTHDMPILLAAELSKHIGETPEGYLICHDVPVSKVGVQHYLGSELGINDRWNESIPVYREAEDVFDEEALRSIESKPVTDDHPSREVNIDNTSIYSRGHGRNARHNDKNVITDLVITDPALKQKIKDKTKYQISLGYTCHYVPFKDGFKQTNIRVNHIAVVETGRAGPKVAIQDKQTVKKGAIKIMDKDTALALMLAAYAKEAAPADVAKVLPFVTDAAPVTAPTSKEPDAGFFEKLANFLTKDSKTKEETEAKAAQDAYDARLKTMEDTLKALVADKKTKDEDKEDEVEKLLAEDEEPEEKETEDEDMAEEEKKAAQDSAFAQVVTSLKPFIAGLPKDQQKAVKDALRGARSSEGTYGKIKKVVTEHKKTNDAAPADLSSIGRNIAATRNPHFMKKA